MESLMKKHEANSLLPLRKPEKQPRVQNKINPENINTAEGSKQFEQTVWRSRKWFEAVNTTPWALGIFFLFIGLIVLGEKRDAEYAPIMFLIAIICLISYFPLNLLGKTKITGGINRTTNTLWLMRKKKILGFEPDAKYIEYFKIQKYNYRNVNPVWNVNSAMPLFFNKREWLLMIKRNTSENEWTFNGLAMATKKDAKAVAEKFNELLKKEI